jgi:NAD(P)-dependent dehydrogenase (short-subunit alcohol dehydrogenase family)
MPSEPKPAASSHAALESRVALVTGASSGLGREIARALAAAGATVAAVARREGPLEQLRAELGARVLPFAADVTRPEEVDALQARVREWAGPPSILVNAAGVFGPIAPIAGGDAEAWIAALATNAIGPYLLCRAFAPDMIAAGWGRILNVSSAATLHPPTPLNSAYVTSKVALNRLTRQLAAELEGTGVTANVLHPGDVKTDMWAEIRDAASRHGAAAAPFLEWADLVERTGGDPPRKAAELVVRHVTAAEAANGRFLWIEDALQAPIPAWDADQEPTWT